MAATELALAATAVIFRFILVKYSERGLVTGGVVSKLFDHLYACLGATLTILLYALAIASNFRKGEDAFISICLNQEFNTEDSWRNYYIRCALILVVLATLSVLFWSVQTFVRLRSKDGKTPPAIFGRFQRNILTFNETMAFHIFMTASMLAATGLNILFHTIQGCIILFMFPTLFSFYILVKSYMNPTLLTTKERPQSQIFYIREPQIQPRRDHIIEVHPNILPASIIYVKPYNTLVTKK